MGLLNRDSLLKRDLLDIRRVDLPGGDFVFVRQMTGRERDIFERSMIVETKDKKGRTSYQNSLADFRAKLAVCTLCDEQGELLLRPDDYEVLSTHMTAAKLDKIVTEAQALNAISEEDRDNLVKNSEPGQNEDSTSACAGTLDTPTPTTSLPS